MEGNTQPMSTQRPSSTDEVLLNKFDEDFVEQANRISEVAKLLITIELAVPGMYATALKLVQGKESIVTLGFPVYLAFGFWLVALVLSLVALLPQTYHVDRTVIRRDLAQQFDFPLSIEAYFIVSAKHKYRWVCSSCLCFFSGLIAALCSLF